MPGFGLKSINFSKTTPSLPAKVLDQPVGRAAEEPRYHDRLEFLRALSLMVRKLSYTSSSRTFPNVL